MIEITKVRRLGEMKQLRKGLRQDLQTLIIVKNMRKINEKRNLNVKD